jgi:hypothetical protein
MERQAKIVEKRHDRRLKQTIFKGKSHLLKGKSAEFKNYTKRAM